MSSEDMSDGVAQEKPPPHNTIAKSTTEPVYPATTQIVVVVAGLYVTAFLVALDRLIIGVAIPRITDEFDSLGDVGWYGSAYLLTTCSFMLFMGRVYTFYDPKWVYMSSLVVFEIGSALCGAAPSSDAFIIGRAVAGLGFAGLVQGAIIIITYIVPLHKRPQYTGFIGMVFGIASALGPLLGGAFTDGPGWRWCFYINLPLGAVVLLIQVFFLHIPKDNLLRNSTTVREKVTRLDPVGLSFFLPAIICLLLALQWGGITSSWSSVRIIVLLVLFALCLIIFTGVQRWKGEDATMPGHIFFNRSILAGAWFTFFQGGAMVTILYFLPLWFQAIKGVSAVKSGIMILPTVIGMTITSISAGILTRKIGYYTQWLIASSVLTPIGAGLVSTFMPATPHPQWISYQVLFGLGLGLGQQQSSVAAQTVLEKKDVPTGAALVMFCQTLGGAIFFSVGNNLFDAGLKTGLADIRGINISTVAISGATDLRDMVPVAILPQVLTVYNAALQRTFYLATALTCVTFFGALTMEWKSVRREMHQSRSKADEATSETK